MLCKNCEKEIGNNVECGFCGYNSVIDADGDGKHIENHADVKVPPVKIRLKKMPNGSATAGFVLSLFGFCFVPFGILSLIFSLVGFFKAKKCRKGRVLSFIGLILSTFWGFANALYFYLIFGEVWKVYLDIQNYFK